MRLTSLGFLAALLVSAPSAFAQQGAPQLQCAERTVFETVHKERPMFRGLIKNLSTNTRDMIELWVGSDGAFSVTVTPPHMSEFVCFMATGDSMSATSDNERKPIAAPGSPS